jgi:hypothetical protein
VSWSPEVDSALNSQIGIGSIVQKVSRRRFKSGLFTATVKGKVIGEGGRLYLTFLEDDTSVEIRRCELLTGG